MAELNAFVGLRSGTSIPTAQGLSLQEVPQLQLEEAQLQGWTFLWQDFAHQPALVVGLTVKLSYG